MGGRINLQILLGQATWIWCNVCKLKNLQEFHPIRSIDSVTNTIKDGANHRDRTWKKTSVVKSSNVRKHVGKAQVLVCIKKHSHLWQNRWLHLLKPLSLRAQTNLLIIKRNLSNNPKLGKLRGSLFLSLLSLSLSCFYLHLCIKLLLSHLFSDVLWYGKAATATQRLGKRLHLSRS